MPRYRIEWTTQAVADLDAILAHYVDVASEKVARAVGARIVEAVAGLEQFPLSTRQGRVEGTRELVIPKVPYLAVIELVRDRVYVLTIVHTARMFPDGNHSQIRKRRT